jgi:hypothetical protein
MILVFDQTEFGEEHKPAASSTPASGSVPTPFGNGEEVLRLLARVLVYYVPGKKHSPTIPRMVFLERSTITDIW